LNLARKRNLPLSLACDDIYIRRYELLDDAELYQAARESIHEVYRFLMWCHPGYSLSDSRTWLKTIQAEWERGTSYAFAIRDRRTNEFLGGCGLNQVDENPVMNLGYWVKTSACGCGVASQAARALVQFGFDHLGLIRIEIVMSVRNAASRRVAEKTGANCEGVLANRLLLHGEAHDAWLFALTPGTRTVPPPAMGDSSHELSNQ
jgi:ribosomal-protein-serine acetyltransferase